jgi:hypothetical protein
VDISKTHESNKIADFKEKKGGEKKPEIIKKFY